MYDNTCAFFYPLISFYEWNKQLFCVFDVKSKMCNINLYHTIIHLQVAYWNSHHIAVDNFLLNIING